MAETTRTEGTARGAVVAKRRPSRGKALWQSIRKPLANSRFAKSALVWLLAKGMRFIAITNPRIDKTDLVALRAKHSPAILALWHGQHLLAPCYFPKGESFVAMVSRSADAELNARVLAKLGHESVRGSGGRAASRNADKGGASALIALKKFLDAGRDVAMIADIPHGTPRDSGMGIVTLAKLSGRPILPAAVTTSRRKVLEKSWDKTTINLPFGRGAVVIGEPIFVSADATPEECEAARRDVTRALNHVTVGAYSLVDRRT